LVFSYSGGLGMLNDGDAYRFLQWSPPSEPILLMFAFDSIKEFHSINLDIKCSLLSSSSCSLKINIGVLEIVTSDNLWTNRFRSVEIENNQYHDNTTITHLILALSKTKGQFVIIQINTKDGLALSEVTFDNRNENDDEEAIIPSSIYIETNLRRLELLALNSKPDEVKCKDARKYIFEIFSIEFPLVHGRLLNLFILILIICGLLGIFIFISCMFSQKQRDDYE